MRYICGHLRHAISWRYDCNAQYQLAAWAWHAEADFNSKMLLNTRLDVVGHLECQCSSYFLGADHNQTPDLDFFASFFRSWATLNGIGSLRTLFEA